MKALFAILFCAVMVEAQSTDYMTVQALNNSTKNNSQIKARVFDFATSDTTYPQYIGKQGNIQVGVMTLDTVSIIVRYQLSVDGISWSAITTIDSCVQSTAVPSVKGINVSTVALGMQYIRFVFNFTKSNVYGVTYTSANRKYYATLKKY